MQYFVKICGNMHLEDSTMAAEFDPDYMGWIFSPKSLRMVKLEQIIPVIEEIKKFKKEILHVAVFADNTINEILEIVSGTEVFDCLQIAEEPKFINELQGVLKNNLINKLKFYNSEKEKILKEGLPIIIPAVRVNHVINDETLSSFGKFPLYILDSYVPGQPGGTGKTLNSEYIKNVTLPYLLAGGLSAENVKNRLLSCSAIGADVSSGVENSPGKKNKEKIKAFIDIVRSI